MPIKPVVFFSHSSRDAELLTRLKTLFVDKTGGSLDVFLSSDGQSIRLGQNWVHRIEEALKSAGLIFVFMTPQSVRSGWLFFETGHAYAMNKRVVPVALGGIEVGRISPPLSLFQGFNVTSAESLNNLIATVNDVFGHAHTESFSQEDYTSLFAEGTSPRSELLTAYLNVVDTVTVRVPSRPLGCDDPREVVARLRDSAHAAHLDHISIDGTLVLAGLQFSAAQAPIDELVVEIDPNTADQSIKKMETLLSSCGSSTLWDVEIRFVESVYQEYNLSRVTGRILSPQIKLVAPFKSENGVAFVWDSIRFQLEDILSFRGNAVNRDAVALCVRVDDSSVPRRRIGQLIAALFRLRVLELVDVTE